MIKESLIFIAESDDKDKRLDAFLQEEMDDAWIRWRVWIYGNGV